MSDPRFDVMLDASDPDFVAKFRTALGIGPNEAIQFITPEFERRDGVVVRYLPRRVEEYAALPTYSADTLLKLGCRKWDKVGDTVYWLFPKEWYPYIPAGLIVTDINYETEEFVPGVTDDDIRYGCLAYGFTTQEPK